ncbi:MAG: hypothetical protein HWD89_06290 [Tenacibaculum sp.]|uniref:hypothetical protein n=1 Tax=Tenacibaculum TaxID=104267 RepID=UPI0013DFC02E|nr:MULTISPECIES: hypothetical protein [Tenacibaculum]NVK08644.1 hypothetical protein [Tenacibaculum sp.]
MEKQNDDFKIIKENPKSKNRNYIFQNNKITRIAFFVILFCLIIGITMVFTFNEQ